MPNDDHDPLGPETDIELDDLAPQMCDRAMSITPADWRALPADVRATMRALLDEYAERMQVRLDCANVALKRLVELEAARG